MEDLFDQLADLFGVHEMEFDIAHSGTARATAAQQADLYASLAGTFRHVNFHNRGRNGLADSSQLAHHVLDWVVHIAKEYPATVDTRGDKAFVISALPILFDPTAQQLMEFVRAPAAGSRPESVAAKFATAFAAALLAEANDDRAKISFREGILAGNEELVFNRLTAEYIAIKAGRRHLQRSKVNFDAEIAVVTGAIANFKSEFEIQRDRQRMELDGLTGASLDMHEKLQGHEKGIDDSKERLENFEATIREELGLNSARQTWERRFKESRIAFAVSCVLLLCILVGTIGCAVYFGRSFLAMLTNMELATGTNGDNVAIALTHQFGRLIIFSVPAIVFLWTLRAVMRFFMRSMLLMDDARQRQTMLDTYFLLSEQGRADERDRPMILWALFRQTPGHGPDGIEPPDFTEVINAGMQRTAGK